MFPQLLIALGRQFSLGKNERLKHRKLIEQLFKKGRNFTIYPFRVFYLFPDNLSYPLQAGFGASIRNFKKAVDRNRIKRVTREAYRSKKNDLSTLLTEKKMALSIFFIYTAKELPNFHEVTEKLDMALQKLITIVNEKNTPGS